MESSFITPEKLADRWRITTGTLARWRRYGTGPLFHKTDDGVFYKLQDIEAYENDRTFQSTAEYPPELKRKVGFRKNLVTSH
jgi:CRISPR/Cas system-associated protein Cas7 (RAMP superfamily)